MTEKATMASYATNSVAFVWGAMTLNQILALAGFALGVATYLTSIYFQKRRDRREVEFHLKRMQRSEDEQ